MTNSQRGAVEFRAIRKDYGSFTAIPQLNLSIEPGQLVTLLGPSGCGKTTTLRMLAGLETPTEGAIMIGGQDVTRLPPNRRDVTMVFQSYALFPHMSVLANIAYGLESEGIAKAEARGMAEKGLDLVGLAGLGERLPSELSGGQQQRVAVARALAGEPEIIFADEPTGNLDSRSGAEILQFMQSAVRDFGQTIVMVTHDPVAAGYADRALFLADGKIVDDMASPTADKVLDRLKRLDG